MIYTRLHSSLRIDCQNEKCGEWHEAGHSLQDMLPGDYYSIINSDGDIIPCCISCGEEFDDGSTMDTLHPMHPTHGYCCTNLVARIVSACGLASDLQEKQWMIDRMLLAGLGKPRYDLLMEDFHKEGVVWEAGQSPLSLKIIEK
jgi:hypothetical protein